MKFLEISIFRPQNRYPMTETKDPNQGSHLFNIGIIAFVFIVAYSYTFDSKLAMLGDNASYFALGKAMATGEGYVNVASVSKSPHNHYPPGYPVIISTVMIFTENITVIKLVNGAISLAGLLLIYFVTQRVTLNHLVALGVTLLAALNSHLLWYSSLIMSEIPFMFFSVLGVYLFTKTDFESLPLKNKYFWGSLLAVIAAYYIRSLGVALLGGFILALLFNKRWKAIALYIAGFAVAVIPWFIRGSRTGGSSYIKQLKMINPYQPALGQADFGDFVDRFFTNFQRYITRELPDAVFPVVEPNYGQPATSGQWLIGLIILGLMVYGIIRLSKYKWLITGYLLGTLAILMLWPDVWIGVRFIVPAIPFFVLIFFNGLYSVLRLFLKSANEKIIVYSLTVLLLLFHFSPVSDIHTEAKRPYSPAWQNYFAAAEWLKKNEQKDVVVSCGKPALFYLHSGVFTTRYKFLPPEELIANLEKSKVDYVVIDQAYGNTLRYLLPAVRQYPDRFQQVYHLSNPDTYLLKFRR